MSYTPCKRGELPEREMSGEYVDAECPDPGLSHY